MSLAPADVIQLIGVSVAGLSVLSIVSAVARRIAGPYSRRGEVLGAATRDEGGRDVAGLEAEVDQLRQEVDAMRSRFAELDDLQNRLDFTERMLAQWREKNALPGPR